MDKYGTFNLIYYSILYLIYYIYYTILYLIYYFHYNCLLHWKRIIKKLKHHSLGCTFSMF